MKVKFSILFTALCLLGFGAFAQTSPATAETAVAKEKTIPVAEHFEGGQEAMYEFINKELKYPALAKRNRIMGQCIISFTLNPDGTVSNARILKNAGGGTGEEALRVVKLLPFNAPGYALQTSIPINFKL